MNAPVFHPPWLTELVESTNSVTARQISRYVPPADGSGRRSAVLILLADAWLTDVSDRPQQASEPSVVLLLRASTMRKHPGQVAFPGGGVDPEDADATSTALREANEEIGLDPDSVDIIGRLPDLFLPVSSFVVTPVLGFWREPHPVHAVDPGEVAGVTIVKIADLVDPANRFSTRLREDLVGPAFEVDGLFVWGFTAGVLNAVLEMAGWAVPWDTTAVRAIPASVRSATDLARGLP